MIDILKIEFKLHGHTLIKTRIVNLIPFLQVVGLRDITLVFVESICRVKTLSLSGKIMYYIADHFLVQWKQLQINFPNSIYLGRLV